MSIEIVANQRCFDGEQIRFKHQSAELNCDMHASIFLPPQAKIQAVPVIYWLSGLTCTDENFVTKAGAQQFAAQYGVAVVAPDTSPRGEHVPDDPDGAYDFGLGAGFYVDATQPPWREHYRMYSYICEELPKLIESNFAINAQRASIMGHSMGGHGALTIALKNPKKYRCVSAFAPIVSPLNCPWGEKALAQYIGKDKQQWRAYDSVALIEDNSVFPPIKIDQGAADNFLEEQLKPELILQASKHKNLTIDYALRQAYDHSYFFISSFIGEHIAWHSAYLND
jgi:S-formylglutathione hydrolase